MALLNWFILIALVMVLAAYEQPAQSFTNDALVFTNATCARIVSSWEHTLEYAKWVDARLLATEMKIANAVMAAVPRGFNAFAENFRPSRWLPPHLYADLMKHACGA